MSNSEGNLAEVRNKLLEELVKLIHDFSNRCEDDSDVHQCICDNCGRQKFKDYRYKCLICKNFDLCSNCFEKRKVCKDHKTGHPMVRFLDPNNFYGKEYTNEDLKNLNIEILRKEFDKEVHQDITCDVCGVTPIVGLRLKCESCRDYDLCYNCFKSNKTSKTHRLDHPLIIIGKTVSNRIDRDDLDLRDKLGSGFFGTVYKAQYKNKTVACKIMQFHPIMLLIGKDPKTLFKAYVDEIRAYNEIKGVNVLKFLGHYEEADAQENTFKLYILTEFMEKGSLTDVIKNENDLSNRRRLSLAVHIARGMRRIHDLGFIHRDIRPDNILVSGNYTAKIGDMGIAKFFEPSTIDQTQIGCIRYMPPEFYEKKYSDKLDIFTFGLTLVELFEGKHSLDKGRIKVERSKVLWELIEPCLNDDPEQRPKASELEEALDTINKIFLKIISEKKEYLNYDVNEKNLFFLKYYEMIIRASSHINSQKTTSRSNIQSRNNQANSAAPNKKDKNCQIL